MRLIGLTSFYDEQPKMLAAMIASGSKLEIDHWVFLDGAYMLYPGGQPTSQPEQHETIARTCHGMGIGWTIHVPQSTWHGNEVEKRTALFAYGHEASKDGDWLVVMDADQTFRKVPADLRKQLAESDLDAGQVTFLNYTLPKTEQQKQFHWEPITRVQIPIFFRRQNGPIKVVGNHYTYVAPDGRKLWGHGLDKSSGRLTDYLDLSYVEIDHRTESRSQVRSRDKAAYYQHRESAQIEQPLCMKCEEPATHESHADIDLTPDKYVEAWVVAACDAHFEEIEKAKFEQMAKLGIPRDYFLKNAPVAAVA